MINSKVVCKPYRFECSNKTLFEISTSAWLTMQSFRQFDINSTEAGGVLLGRHLYDGSAIIVDLVTVPMPGDRRSRTRFYRDQYNHQLAIDEQWNVSQGICTYLGEWHTHPEAYPRPSIIDLNDWNRRLRADTFSEPIFFVIVGTSEVTAWEGTKIGGIRRLLEVNKQTYEN